MQCSIAGTGHQFVYLNRGQKTQEEITSLNQLTSSIMKKKNHDWMNQPHWWVHRAFGYIKSHSSKHIEVIELYVFAELHF